MRSLAHIDTGMERFELHSNSEFRDLPEAVHAAIGCARDFMLRRMHLGWAVLPESFVELADESGRLLAMLPLRRVIFDEAIADRHRELCEAIPYPWLRLNRDLVILDANTSYLCATLTAHDQIVGADMFDAFPDNPSDQRADGVEKLSASLQGVLHTREPHIMMSPQRYDIRGGSGVWHERHWRPFNVPVLDHNGEVAAIIHHVEHVTLPATDASYWHPGRRRLACGVPTRSGPRR